MKKERLFGILTLSLIFILPLIYAESDSMVSQQRAGLKLQCCEANYNCENLPANYFDNINWSSSTEKDYCCYNKYYGSNCGLLDENPSLLPWIIGAVVVIILIILWYIIYSKSKKR